jgi:hypothetical protein
MRAIEFSDFNNSAAIREEDVKRILSFISIPKLWKNSFAK